MGVLPRAVAGTGRAAGRRPAGRGRRDELPHGQPASADGLVLPPDTGAAADPGRGHRVSERQLRRPQPGSLARPRPGRDGGTGLRARRAARFRRDRPPTSLRRPGRARPPRCGQLLLRRAARPAGDHRGRARGRCDRRRSTSPTRPATCRWTCTTGAWTWPPGAPTNTSTAPRARSPERSCTSGTWATRAGPGCTAGGAPTRPSASGCGPRSTSSATADAWSLSNPPILALAPVLLSLEMFDRVGMPALRERSVRLTAYLEGLLDRLDPSGPT